MPRRNRVDPHGRIVAEDFRGAFIGNRGVLHDDDGRIVREWRNRAWITCALAFKGRHRELLQPGRWTELFFWDEATALAAGHRPCFECRRRDAVRFRDLFRLVTGDDEARAPDIDRQLARERRQPQPDGAVANPVVLADAAQLPAGAMVIHDGDPHLVDRAGLRRWTTEGYRDAVAVPHEELVLITPLTTTHILGAGYEPVVVGANGTA